MRIGVDVDSITDTDLMRMRAVFQDEDSLVFGFSIGGQKEEIIFLLKEAKKRGAKTILFTANNRDDYKEFCTEVVLVPSLLHLNHGNVISPQFPILIMTDIIYSYYVTNISNYNLFYGSLSNIIVLMLWIYFLAYILVFVMAINVNTYKNSLDNKN